MQTKITTRLVEKLGPHKQIFDTAISGFGVRRQTRSSHKSYFVKTTVNGRQRLYSIGKHGSPWTVETARREAKRLLGEVAAGRDPAARRPSRDVASVVEEFFREHVVAKGRAANTQREYRRQIDRVIKPRIGRLAASAVTTQDIERLHYAMRATPYLANRTLALLSKFFKWCEPRYRDRGTNAARDLERYPEHQRHRDLDNEELTRIATQMRSLESELPFAIAAIRLLLLTGCRRQEILELRWEYVRLDQELLRLPQSKTGPKVVPLSEAAMRVLASLPRLDGNPFVIAGRHAGKPLVGLGRIWKRLLREARIEPRTGPNGKLQQMRLHDLRHHVASTALQDGATLAEIGKLLGHASTQTTARYARLRDEAATRTADRIGRTIGKVIA